MVLVPWLVGTLASGPCAAHFLLGGFWLVGYFAFFATALWLKSGRKQTRQKPMLSYGALATILGIGLVATSPELIRWVPAFLGPLSVGLWSAAHRTERSLANGITTVIGSSIMTLVAYDLGGGTQWAPAILTACGLAAYFVGTVFFVKTMIRQRGNVSFWWVSVSYHVVVTIVVLWVDFWFAVIFAVITVRAAMVPRYQLRPAQVGVLELVATAILASYLTLKLAGA